MSFSNNWFQITARKNFEKYMKGGHVLEIGCHEGAATVWMLSNTDATIDAVDTFEGSPEHVRNEKDWLLERFLENTQPHKDRVRVFKGKSQEVLRTLTGAYDFIYIDGSHTAVDVLEDAVLAYRLLRPGGVIIFDDYLWGESVEESQKPTSGVDAFIYFFRPDVLESNAQMIVKKPI